MVNMPSSETRILPGESGLPGTRRWSDAQRSTALKGEKKKQENSIYVKGIHWDSLGFLLPGLWEWWAYMQVEVTGVGYI